jgi:hypothetical protein
MVPQPLRQFQHRPLTRDNLRAWVDGVIAAKGLDIPLKRRSDFLDEVEVVIKDYEATHVSAAASRWGGVMRRPIAIAQQDESPFDVLELIRVARHRLILIAQNHGFMTFSDKTPVIEELLFRKLGAGVVIEIIAMHARAQPIPSGRPSPPVDACAVWADYLRVPQFSEQLDRCWDTPFRSTSWTPRTTMDSL